MDEELMVDGAGRLSTIKRSQTVEDLDELPQPAVITAVKTERDAWKVEKLIVFPLLGCRLYQLDLFAIHDVSKILVQPAARRSGRRVLKPDDQQFVDKAHGVVIAIKAGDNLDRV